MRKKITPIKKGATPGVGYIFAGIALHPLTIQRQEVACAMGLKRGFVMQYKVQDLLADTRIALWLCSLPAEGSKGWTVDRAEGDIDEAKKRSREWATKMGIGIGSKRFNEGYEIFTTMMKEIRECTGQPVISKTEGDGTGETGEL